ncbi:MAG: hypothetical protein EA428_08010 [Spirochaetaceae bacterium]|nr:MAG: hypothetical protein EA428_08010 [Spirochaetaceae bacterium]
MKHTAALAVLGDFSFDEKTINIHPNDGFDLGFMVTNEVVRIYFGCTLQEFQEDSAQAIYGKIHLKNECRNGSIELSLRTVEKIGKPKKIAIFRDQDRIFLQPA